MTRKHAYTNLKSSSSRSQLDSNHLATDLKCPSDRFARHFSIAPNPSLPIKSSSYRVISPPLIFNCFRLVMTSTIWGLCSWRGSLHKCHIHRIKALNACLSQAEKLLASARKLESSQLGVMLVNEPLKFLVF